MQTAFSSNFVYLLFSRPATCAHKTMCNCSGTAKIGCTYRNPNVRKQEIKDIGQFEFIKCVFVIDSECLHSEKEYGKNYLAAFPAEQRLMKTDFYTGNLINLLKMMDRVRGLHFGQDGKKTHFFGKKWSDFGNQKADQVIRDTEDIKDALVVINRNMDYNKETFPGIKWPFVRKTNTKSDFCRDPEKAYYPGQPLRIPYHGDATEGVWNGKGVVVRGVLYEQLTDFVFLVYRNVNSHRQKWNCWDAIECKINNEWVVSKELKPYESRQDTSRKMYDRTMKKKK